MGQKHYPQTFKEEVVIFYERNHTIAETLEKYGICETTLFEWKKRYDQAHHLFVSSCKSLKQSRQSGYHLEKLALELEVLQKCNCGIHSSNDEKIEAVTKLEGQYSVHVLCDALHLSRGTYYNRKRKAGILTSYELSDAALKPIIEAVFINSKRRFGRKPIHQKLLELGHSVSEKRIVRLMKEMNLQVEPPKYEAKHKKPLSRCYYKNHLLREFDQIQPNLAWVSDITYVKVDTKYWFICVILDLFSRRVLSYGISDTIDTTLTLYTFDAAFTNRARPTNLLFHSDQGVQYTAFAFREHLRENGVQQSFSSPGQPYDNSVCESFFHTLKKEALYRHLYEKPEELKSVLDEYIHLYNEDRPHRKLNMKTPLQYEAEFFDDPAE